MSCASASTTSAESFISRERRTKPTSQKAARVHSSESTNPIMYVRAVVISQYSHQIHKRKNKYPDNIKKVPKQRKTGEFSDVSCSYAGQRNVRHENEHPQRTKEDVQPMRPDKGKEGGEEGASRGAATLGNKLYKLVYFHP